MTEVRTAINNIENNYAPLASPAFTGSPTVNGKAFIIDSGTTKRTVWVQSNDPGASAADGDIWFKV
jgi:hypothetical protein